MNNIEIIIIQAFFVLIVVGFVLHSLFLSRQARCTNEIRCITCFLERMNEAFEKDNIESLMEIGKDMERFNVKFDENITRFDFAQSSLKMFLYALKKKNGLHLS